MTSAGERRQIEMVGVLVGDQDQARRRQALVERGAADRVVIDDEAARHGHHEGGVLDRVDGDVAAVGRVGVAWQAAAWAEASAPAGAEDGRVRRFRGERLAARIVAIGRA